MQVSSLASCLCNLAGHIISCAYVRRWISACAGMMKKMPLLKLLDYLHRRCCLCDFFDAFEKERLNLFKIFSYVVLWHEFDDAMSYG